MYLCTYIKGEKLIICTYHMLKDLTSLYYLDKSTMSLLTFTNKQ